MDQRETFGCRYIANSVSSGNLIIRQSTAHDVGFAAWNCSETKAKQNRRSSNYYILYYTNTKFETLWMIRVYNFVIHCQILSFICRFQIRPKSGVMLNSAKDVDRLNFVKYKTIFDKIANSIMLMMTSLLLTTRLGRKIHKNSMGNKKKNHATDCCLQYVL